MGSGSRDGISKKLRKPKHFIPTIPTPQHIDTAPSSRLDPSQVGTRALPPRLCMNPFTKSYQ